MSLAKECPFILSYDAIANLSVVLDHLRTRNYRAAPGSGYDQFRPELHLPVQLIAHTCTHAPTHVSYGHRSTSVDNILALLQVHLNDRYADSDGDITFGLKDPFVRIVFDSDHGIRHDPSRYGADLIATQLVIDHACRLRDLLARYRTSYSPNAQALANGKLNITIVTQYPATIAIAQAEGFQVWEYGSSADIVHGLSGYDRLLLKQGLVRFTTKGTVKVPVKYEKGADSKSTHRPVPTDPII